MRSLKNRVLPVVLLVIGVVALDGRVVAAEKVSFKLAWSVYVGWMPWDYADQSGILKKWADKYGITIKLTKVESYVDSINQYTAGAFDGCAMTNMDVLTIPAAGGVDSTALILGDFSNGNDGIVLKGKGRTLADIKGQPVQLVELSVSHYLLTRSLATIGLKETDVMLVNTSDAEIVEAFAKPGAHAVVTWKPQLAQIAAMPDTSLVFDSSRLPGEIIDMMVVRTAVLKSNPALGRALVGAWYETLTVISRLDAKATAAYAAMAKASGTDIRGFKGQLATTRMFYNPSEALQFMTSSALPKTMDLVRTFSLHHGLLGKKVKTADAIGIEFPGARMLGDPRNLKVRFDANFTRLAVDGKL